MKELIIPVSPMVGEALAKGGKVIALVQEFVGKLLGALADNKITFDEVLSLIASVVNIGRQLAKK